jgi:Mce-associated membrane protein
VSGGVRQSAADTETVPVNEDETPTTAAEIRSLAEQAEAEAAEAEALAAAARARARAIQLRRQAELVEASAAAAEKEGAAEETAEVPAPPVTEVVVTKAAAEVEATEEDEADAAETVQSEKQEPGSQDEAGKAEETEEVAVDGALETEEEPDVDVSADEATTKETEEKPLRLGRVRRLRRRPKWSTVAAAVAILITVAALAGSGYMIKEHHDAVRKRQRAAEFAAVARQGVVTLTSLDFNNAKQGVQRILDNSTGTFKDDFVKMADDFTKVVEQSKVVSQGTVQAAAVDLNTMTDNSAVVLVASTSEVTNAAGAKQDPRSYRLIVTVARDGDQLKISKVEFVP